MVCLEKYCSKPLDAAVVLFIMDEAECDGFIKEVKEKTKPSDSSGTPSAGDEEEIKSFVRREVSDMLEDMHDLSTEGMQTFARK